LFDDLDGRARAVATTHPEHVGHVFSATERILAGRFDLLGSGDHVLSRSQGGLDWHLDWRSGKRWPADAYHTDLAIVRGDGSDVKLPWELSRCQHLLALGQAYLLAPHTMDPEAATRLRGRCALEARHQIDDWIDSNPRGVGINWTCAMEVAMRAFSWLATLALFRGAPELDDTFFGRIVAALWMHGRHVRQNLEISAEGLTSNHYLADVVGLHALAVGLPELEEAAEWGTFAREALECEIGRQVHPDGVDFERSLPYHRLVTEFFLHSALLLRAGGAAPSGPFVERLARMLEFSAAATRPDHSVAQWGDNDDGRLLPLDGYATQGPQDHRHLLALGGCLLERDDLVAAGGGATVEALWLCGAVSPAPATPPAGATSHGFGDARYYVMRDGDLHCGIPCGPVGTLGVGNHSHNDLLSLCVWADGVEWVTDPGTGSYTGDPDLRNRLRSTAAHATIQLGRREQNRPGEGLDGLFRMHERAKPEVTDWQVRPTGARLTARHHGFDGPDDRWVHERSVEFDAAGRRWIVRDRLSREAGEGPLDEPVFLRFPLLPETNCEIDEGIDESLDRLLLAGDRPETPPRRRFTASLTHAGRSFRIALDLPDGTEVFVSPGLHSPRYGVTREAGVLTAKLPPSRQHHTHAVLWSPAPG
jgi:hypothetical protein